MATIVNARDVLLQAESPRVLSAALPGNLSLDFSQVTGTTRPSNNADVTVTAVNGGITVTGGGITLSSGGSIKGGKTAYGSGLGFFLGYSSPSYVFDIGGSANYLRWDGSTLSYTGTLTGVGNIDITGNAKFGGATSSAGFTWGAVANESLGSYGGHLGYATTGRAVMGQATSSGTGVYGVSSGGAGVVAISSSGTGLAAQSTSWNALQITGKSTQDASTYTWNGYAIAAPGGSTTTCLHNDGIYRDPVTTARVNSAYGVAASGVCQKVVTDSGTATVSGTGLNYNCTITGYQFTGSSNNVGLAPVSDRRLKKRIKREQLGLDFVMELKPVSYQMKGRSRTHHGFIAQDVEAILAGRGLQDADDALATESATGVKGTDYLSYIAILVLAVQQQQAQIDELRRRRP